MNQLDSFYDSNIEVFSKNYFNYLASVLENIDTSTISDFVNILLEARNIGSAIFFAGNGGSASTASHFVNDISIGTNTYKKPFRAISLNDNTPVFSAISNDFSYDDVFLRQLMVLSKPGDILVGISASGNSKNLLDAFKYANANNIITVGITAFDGGKLKDLSRLSVHVPTNDKEYGPAEDAHMILDHLIGSYLIRYIKNES